MANDDNSSGIVAENISVYLFGGRHLSNSFICSANPISNSISASSKISTSNLYNVSPVSTMCYINLPGVAMITSGFDANDSNYPIIWCPPSIRVWLRSVNLVNCFNTDEVCKANSLVGRIISALVPTILECSLSLLIKGIRKAAVLPEPVLEHAITSLPYIILGIALLWIGVGTLYPLALIAL